jgi:predicted small secreted protein
MKKTLLACLGLMIALSACNTIQGAGQDIRAGGQGISNAAASTKDKIDNR